MVDSWLLKYQLIIFSVTVLVSYWDCCGVTWGFIHWLADWGRPLSGAVSIAKWMLSCSRLTDSLCSGWVLSEGVSSWAGHSVSRSGMDQGRNATCRLR